MKELNKYIFREVIFMCNCNNKVKVKVKKLHENAIIPEYKTEGSAGFDLHALKEVVIPGNETRLVPTGLAFEIPVGYEIQIRPRSGISLKTPIRISNTPGTIDSDYRGEVGIIVDNLAPYTIVVDKHQRIAQGVLKQVPQAEFIAVEELSDTERGERGFGSTGTK
jgi:dUTP pyrophosphatase